MIQKKLFKRALLLILFIALGFGFHYAWFAFPIISGYAAKNACSCLFIQKRELKDFKQAELGAFPLSLASISVDMNEASVRGSVFGLARKKAIYRKGMGCTLVNELEESTIRAQNFILPPPLAVMDTGQWLTPAPLVQADTIHIKQHLLDSAIATAFRPTFQNKAVHTRAILVVHNGKIIAEKYAPGYNANMPQLGWSMAKSVTGALVGILVKDGALAVSDPAPIPQWQMENDKRSAITIEHLLQQTSGLDYVEDYSKYSNATNMLFYKGNMGGYVATLPLKVAPGTQFYYSSGNSNLLSQIIRLKVGEKGYHAFPYTRLFHKIGMYHTVLEPDASGTFVGSSFIWATPRDFARFGLLYLNKGNWNGEQLLPTDWVQKSIQAPAANGLKNYGYQFWLNGFDEDAPAKKVYPDAPADLYMANGFGGQRIYVIPSKNLVIVRLGLNKFDEHRFLKKVLEATP